MTHAQRIWILTCACVVVAPVVTSCSQQQHVPQAHKQAKQKKEETDITFHETKQGKQDK